MVSMVEVLQPLAHHRSIVTMMIMMIGNYEFVTVASLMMVMEMLWIRYQYPMTAG